MSIAEMFYGKTEDVWVVKPEKKEEVKKGETPPKPPPPTALETAYGQFFPYYHPAFPAAPAAQAAKKPAENKTADFKVPICCEQCVEEVTAKLTAFKGVKKVECDIPNKKVKVTMTTDTVADDVLLECRDVFKKSRLWTKDD